MQRGLSGFGVKMFIFKYTKTTYSNLRYFVRNICVRFAPSPTGQLHIGGLRTALYNYLFAKKHHGRFILRIEDTDQDRVVPGAVQNLESILKWMNISPTEGPSQVGPYGPYVQSERIKLYNDCVQQLLDNGSAYRCFCTESRLRLLRKEALRLRQVPKYDNRCKYLTKKEVDKLIEAEQSYVIRFNMTEGPLEFHDLVFGNITLDISKLEGDPIILKSDKFPTYHLACVIDDHHMKVTHVLRGAEWQVSTPKHLMLFKAFGWKPPKYVHLPLIMNKDGSKLSKRQNDIHVEAIKNKGYSAEAILNFMIDMGGGFGAYNEKLLTLDELVDMFDLEKLNVNSCKMELEKLDIYNKKFLNQSIEDEQKRNGLIEQLKNIVLKKYPNCEEDILTNDKLSDILLWSRLQGHIITLNDFINEEFSFLWFQPEWSTSFSQFTHVEAAKSLLVDVISLMKDFNDKLFSTEIKSLAKTKNLKFSTCMEIIRIGLTGRKEGPGVAEIISILGTDICTKRITNLQHYFEKL